MDTDATDVETLFDAYATALTELHTTGSTEAATGCYAFPALVVRDEVSWAYEDAGPLADDLDTLRQQGQGAGIIAAQASVSTVEPLTGVLTSADVDWDFTNAEGDALLQQGWRYVVQDTADGLRIRSAVIRTRSDA